MDCGVANFSSWSNVGEIGPRLLHEVIVVQMDDLVWGWIQTCSLKDDNVVTWSVNIFDSALFNEAMHGVTLHFCVPCIQKLLFYGDTVLHGHIYVHVCYGTTPILIATAITPDYDFFNVWVGP